MNIFRTLTKLPKKIFPCYIAVQNIGVKCMSGYKVQRSNKHILAKNRIKMIIIWPDLLIYQNKLILPLPLTWLLKFQQSQAKMVWWKSDPWFVALQKHPLLSLHHILLGFLFHVQKTTTLAIYCFYNIPNQSPIVLLCNDRSISDGSTFCPGVENARVGHNFLL